MKLSLGFQVCPQYSLDSLKVCCVLDTAARSHCSVSIRITGTEPYRQAYKWEVNKPSLRSGLQEHWNSASVEEADYFLIRYWLLHWYSGSHWYRPSSQRSSWSVGKSPWCDCKRRSFGTAYSLLRDGEHPTALRSTRQDYTVTMALAEKMHQCFTGIEHSQGLN